jgi:hypothetical protein
MHIDQFFSIVEKDAVYVINNNSATNIVLFGNCHVATIGFYLNLITEKKYNIHIIISFTAKSYAIEKRQKIWKTIEQSDIFIYQKHLNNFDIKASEIDTFAKKIKIIIPNLHLEYTDIFDKNITITALQKNFNNSYQILKKNIETSNFNNFMFVLENYKKIRFFDIPRHPTLYLLYLLTMQICFKIKGNDYKITINDYYKHKNDALFLKNETVVLGGSIPYIPEQCIALGIDIKSEHYNPHSV